MRELALDLKATVSAGTGAIVACVAMFIEKLTGKSAESCPDWQQA